MADHALEILSPMREVCMKIIKKTWPKTNFSSKFDQKSNDFHPKLVVSQTEIESSLIRVWLGKACNILSRLGCHR